MEQKYNLAIVGANSNIGSAIIRILAERNSDIENLYPLDAKSLLGKQVSFAQQNLYIESFENFDFTKADFVIFACDKSWSASYCNIAANSGCAVIDLSGYSYDYAYGDNVLQELEHNIPIVAMGANHHLLNHYKDVFNQYKQNYKNRNNHKPKDNIIIASPNQCVVDLAIALTQIHKKAQIKRLVISTYQSVCSLGTHAMDELYNQTKAKYTYSEYKNKVFSKQISFNILPQVGEFAGSNSTTEEIEIADQIKKVICNDIALSVTCVRVPTFTGNSMSVNIEFGQKIDAETVTNILLKQENVVVAQQDKEDNTFAQNYFTPLEVVGDDEIYISRIRNDKTVEFGVNLWITSDNLRKASALNAIEIIEYLSGSNCF